MRGTLFLCHVGPVRRELMKIFLRLRATEKYTERVSEGREGSVQIAPPENCLDEHE